LNGTQNLTGSATQLPARRFAYAPAPIDHPLNVIVTGQVQNPSVTIALNVIVTIPVVGSWLHDPVAVPVALLIAQSNVMSDWFIVHDNGGPPEVQAK
jgi:hypothetical protein